MRSRSGTPRRPKEEDEEVQPVSTDDVDEVVTLPIADKHKSFPRLLQTMSAPTTVGCSFHLQLTILIDVLFWVSVFARDYINEPYNITVSHYVAVITVTDFMCFFFCPAQFRH